MGNINCNPFINNDNSKSLFLLLFFLSHSLAWSQYTITGIAVDSLRQPIAQVLVKVQKADSTRQMHTIVTTDLNGKFQLSVPEDINYLLSTTHLSYKTTSQEVSKSSPTAQFVLKNKQEQLEEIIIKHKRPKLKQRKDTIIYKLSEYIDPNDRKLRDLVEKLPGLTVDKDGSIYYQGEKITKLLVENESFFGGGTKLGLDNIPADAIEKLEVILNYSKSSILKNSRNSEEKVINLVLKESRKNIIFGQLGGATDFQDFYRVNPTFFLFRPKGQYNVIGASNNLAEANLSINEEIALESVNAELFKLPRIPSEYGLKDSDYTRINNHFVAANVKAIKENSTWDFLGFFKNQLKNTASTNLKMYLATGAEEERTDRSRDEDNNWYVRTTNYFTNTKKERNFGALFRSESSDYEQLTQSDRVDDSSFYNTSSNSQYIDANTYIEETRKLGHQLQVVYGGQLSYSNYGDSSLDLKSDQRFLEQVIPWQDAAQYEYRQKPLLDKFQFKTGGKLFKQLSLVHKLEFQATYDFYQSNFKNEQTQQTDDGQSILLQEPFNQKVLVQSNFLTGKASYTYDKDEWRLIASTKAKWQYGFNEYATRTHHFDFVTIEPALSAVYQINKKKKFNFSYFHSEDAPSLSRLYTGVSLKNYQSLVQGNKDLKKEIADGVHFSYLDANYSKKYSYFLRSSYTYQQQALTSFYEYDGINSFQRFVMQSDAGQAVRVNGRFTYILKNTDLAVSAGANYSENLVQLEELTTSVLRSARVGFESRTYLYKFPEIVFNIGLSETEQVLEKTTGFTSFNASIELEQDIGKQWFTSVSYDYTGIEGRKASDRLNFELRYTTPLKNIDINLIGQNMLDTRQNITINQGNLIDQRRVEQGLGRRILLGLTFYY